MRKVCQSEKLSYICISFSSTVDFLSGSGSSSKRRKIEGLNSRFDRMLEHVKMMEGQSRVKSITSSRHSRDRKNSISTSSVSSHALPKMPVDAYSGLEQGRLGQTFSVIKMTHGGSHHRSGESWHEDTEVGLDQVCSLIILSSFPDSQQIQQPTLATDVQEPLPEWLSTTILNLEPDNPLRLLLPQTDQQESIFAFCSLLSDNREDPHAYEARQFLPELQPLNYPAPDDLQAAYASSILVPRSPSLLVPAIPDIPTDRTEFQIHDITLTDDDMTLFLEDPEMQSLPFSTAGPSSTVYSYVSQCNTASASMPSTYNYPEDKPPLPSVPGPPTRTSKIAPTSLTTMAHPDFTTPTRSQRKDSKPDSLPLSLSPGPLYDPFISKSKSFFGASDSSLNCNPTPITQNLFTTPGPRFNDSIARTVYFDSPTEDPSASTTPDIYKLEDLDFQWQPFFRQDVVPLASNISTMTRKDRRSSATQDHISDNPRSDSNCFSQFDSNEILEDTERFAYNGSTVTDPAEEEKLLIDVEVVKAKSIVFAPTPGIYISPLRHALEHKSGLNLRPFSEVRAHFLHHC